MGRFRHGPESTRTRDRGSRTCRRRLLARRRAGRSRLLVRRHDRRSRTWPFSRRAGRSSAAGSRSGYGGPRAASGRCSTAAGFAWFLPEWNNPGVGSSLAFTVGLCLYAACPPLVAHARARVPRRPARLARSSAARSRVAYVGRRARPRRPARAVYDPQAQGCNQCPRNLLAISDRDGAVDRPQPVRRSTSGSPGRSPSRLLRSWKLARASSWARPVFAAGAVTWGWSRPGSRPRSTTALSRTARWSDVSGSAKPPLSSSSPPESPGAGFGVAGLVRRSRGSSSTSPSRLHRAA